jgi:hypothetical protein
MKPRVKLSLPFGLALIAVAVPTALAQMGANQRQRMPKYDPATVVTVRGTVDDVQEGMMQRGHLGSMGQMGMQPGQMNSSAMAGQTGMMEHGQMNSSANTGQMGRRNHMGLHLTLKTENATYTVLVGPVQFVKDKGFAFAKGDEIEVTGSKVKYGDALIAREIKKGDKTLTLRNEQGIPEWSRGPRS